MGARVWNKTAKIREALRGVWRFSPRKAEALRAARIGRGSYLCNKCRRIFGPKDVQVDHVDPVSNSVSWDEFIEKLFEGRLQVLCKPCHIEKGDHKKRWKTLGTAKQP